MDKKLEKYLKPNLKEARMRKSDIEYKEFILDEKYKSLGEGKKYRIQTYGCQANEADSEIVAGILEKIGFTLAEDEVDADLILLNTCAIRENAENRIWGELGRLKIYKKDKPNLVLGVFGCMPQEERVVEKILDEYPYVSLVYGTHNFYKLPEYIYRLSEGEKRVIEVIRTKVQSLKTYQKNANKLTKRGFISRTDVMSFAHIVLFLIQEEKKGQD